MHNPVYKAGQFPLYYASGEDIRALGNDRLLDQFHEVDAELSQLADTISRQRGRIRDADRLLADISVAALAQINHEPPTPSEDPVALLRRRSVVQLGEMAVRSMEARAAAISRLDRAQIDQAALRRERRIHVEEMVKRFLQPGQHTVTLERPGTFYVLDDRGPTVLVLRD